LCTNKKQVCVLNPLGKTSQLQSSGAVTLNRTAPLKNNPKQSSSTNYLFRARAPLRPAAAILLCVQAPFQATPSLNGDLTHSENNTAYRVYGPASASALLHGSETWVIKKRDASRLEAAEMRFLRSVKGYTLLDKIRRETIRKELKCLQYKVQYPNINNTGSTTSEERTTPDFRNMPSITSLEEKGIVDDQR
jgi:hypothetical protein